MPHQCVKCGSVYKDGSKEILSGCTNCKAKLFFFIKKEKFEELSKISKNLSDEDKEQIQKDVFDIVGVQEDMAPVVLDLESIRIPKPGHYELDLVNLLKDTPLVYRLDEGKYVIDLPESFKKSGKE